MAEIAMNQRRRRGIFVEKQNIEMTSSVGEPNSH
jgi:hypothetical protein